MANFINWKCDNCGHKFKSDEDRYENREGGTQILTCPKCKVRDRKCIEICDDFNNSNNITS